jgi:TonB family protein
MRIKKILFLSLAPEFIRVIWNGGRSVGGGEVRTLSSSTWLKPGANEKKRIKYPELARKAGIEGKVYVMASVDEKGDVVHVDLVRGAGGGLDEEALKAVMNTKFKPGQQRGIPVKVKVVIPVIFKLK